MAKSVPLSDACQEYVRHLRARGLADNTVENNSQVVRRAIALWGDILVSSVAPAHIDHLFSHYGWKESTRNLYLSYLRGFFTWAARRRMMPRDSDPTLGWRAVRVPRVDRLRIPLERFGELLDAAPHPRDRAVCAIGLYTFLRGSEIRLLRVSDLNLDDDSLRVYRQKTREEDVLPVCSELHAEMVLWLNWYRGNRGNLLSDWYLTPAKAPTATFYDREKGQIAVSAELAPLRPEKPIHRPYLAVQRAMSGAGYTDVYWQGEHTLRRSGARALADSLRDQGYDGALLRVASMLGHHDVRVTQRYVGWELERQQRNESIAGKPLFPQVAELATVTELRREA